jgi:hypothetical protein
MRSTHSNLPSPSPHPPPPPTITPHPCPPPAICRSQRTTCEGSCTNKAFGGDSCSPYIEVDSTNYFFCSTWKCGKDYNVGTSTCASCAANRYGSSCTPCSCGVSGTCNSGMAGDGACTCKTGYTGSDCGTCAAQYVKSGSTCLGPCPGGDCGSGGSCTVLSGTLSCACDAGWKGTAPKCVCVCVCVCVCCVCVCVCCHPSNQFVTSASQFWHLRHYSHLNLLSQ